jgi:hypothetical protein
VTNRWYIRKEGWVRGPYPTGALVQDHLVGRIADTDLISLDQVDWRPLAAWPELVNAITLSPPPSAGSADDGWVAERTHARVRWADQRGGDDRRGDGPSQDESDARRRESEADRRAGLPRTPSKRGPRSRKTADLFGTNLPIWMLLGGLMALAALIGVLVYVFGPVNPVAVQIR